nr:hypothetical protein [Deltaproteobacteria bacterium]
MTAVAAWRTGALGDFVLTLPVLHRLADLGPLTMIAPDRYRALFPRAARWLDSDGAAVTAWLAGRPPAWRFDHAIGWTPTACEALA